MRIRHLAFVSLVAIGVGAVACSGGAGSSCGSFFDSFNAYANKCGSSFNLDTSQKANFESYCDALSKAPGASNFSGQVDQCNSKLQSADCNTTVNCKIAGSLADGTACGVSSQCSGGRCDNATTVVPNSEVTCGKCASYVAPGGSCSTGLSCDPGTSECVNGTCVAFVQQGASCQTAPCASGLQCDATAHTCQPYPTKGAACTGVCQSPYKCVNQQCADAVQAGGACQTSFECASGLSCVTNKCTQPTLAGSGQPCGFVQNQLVECQSGLKCQTSGTATGTCVAPKNLGEACSVGKSECAAYLFCINGTCQVPDYSVCK